MNNPESNEPVVEGQTVIELHDGTFVAVKDSEVDAKLEELNQTVTGQAKHATVYSKSGLTPQQVEETLKSLEK